MSTFKVRIEDKIGALSPTDDSALSDFLTAGAKFITNILPVERAEKFTVDLADAGSGVSVVASRILRAHKSGYGARRIDAGLASDAINSDSIHYALTTDPVWYILNGLAFVKPTSGTVVGMAYPTVAYGDSTITAFPADLDEGVVLYACIQGRLRQMADLSALIAIVYTNTDTALTNQDIELSGGHLNKVQVQLSQYNSRLAEYVKGLESLNQEFNDFLKSI